MRSHEFESSSVTLLPHGHLSLFCISYLNDLIRTCPNLYEISLNFTSSYELDLVAHGLQPSSDSLVNISFESYSSHKIRRLLPASLVQEALGLPLFHRIKQLRLVSIENDTTIRRPALALAPTMLCINDNFAKITHVAQFFPTDRSSLVRFSFRVLNLQTIQLRWLLEWLPRRIQEISISHNAGFISIIDHPSLTRYAQDHSLPSITLDLVSRFTSLHTLILNEFQGPSVALLHTLVTASPSLVIIDFARSYWIKIDGSYPAHSGLLMEAVFPLSEVLSAVVAFRHLDFIHFGWLPTRDWKYCDGLIMNL